MDGGIATRGAAAARTRVAAVDWKEAIRAACAPLVASGAFEQRYEDRCVSILEEQGPYIVLAPGIALAHARPEDGAHRIALGVAVLARPVAFGHPRNDPVDVVLVFGSPDRDVHVGVLASLARHLIAGLADRLRTADSDASATAILEEVIGDEA